MKKYLSKSFLAVLICAVTVGSSVIFGSGETTSIYGSETEACKLNYNSYSEKGKATDRFMNGDFSEGLKYWCKYTGSNSTTLPDGVSVSSEKTLKFGNVAAWSGAASFQFKIPGIKDGDYVSAVFRFKGTVSNAQAQVYQVRENSTESTGIVKGDVRTLEKSAPSADEWGWATITFNASSTDCKSVANVEKNDTFWFSITPNKTNVTFEIDDIKIVKVLSSGYFFEDVYTGDTYSREDIYGTQTDGCSDTNNAKYSQGKSRATEKIANADFSNGLKYVFNPSGGSLSTGLSVVDGVLNFTAQKKYDAFGIYQFKAPLVKNGDYVSAVFKYNGDPTAAQAYITQIKSSGSKVIVKGTLKWISEPDQDGWGFATMSFETKNAVSDVESDNTFFFAFEIKNKESSCKVDDIKIVTTTSETTQFKDVYTGETVYSEKYYGTADKGTTSKWNLFDEAVNKGNVLDSIQNADFSEGLKFWANGKNVGSALANGISVSDGVLKFTCSNNYDAIASMPFKAADVMNGDYLTAIFKIKTDSISDVEAEVVQLRPDSNCQQGKLKGRLKWISEPDTNGWGLATIIIPNDATSVANIETQPAFYITISIASSGKSLELDDVQIVTNNKAGNNYYDAYTGKLVSGEIKLGDVNDDGDVNIADLVRINEYIEQTYTGRICNAAADMNNSSSIDNDDLIALRNHLLEQ